MKNRTEATAKVASSKHRVNFNYGAGKWVNKSKALAGSEVRCGREVEDGGSFLPW